MKKEIIDLRLTAEELEELPMYHWKELLRERKKEVKIELRRLKEASEFLETATAEDLRMRALDYKRVVKQRVGRDKKVTNWIRINNMSEEKKEKEQI